MATQNQYDINMKKLSNSMSAISKRNQRKAYKYFESISVLPTNRTKNEYVLHHKDPELKHNDLMRYIEWNIDDLVVLTRSEHSRLHNTGNTYHTGHQHSETTKELISSNRKGKNLGNTTGKGRIHMTNGVINKMIKPEEYEKYVDIGFYAGRTLHK